MSGNKTTEEYYKILDACDRKNFLEEKLSERNSDISYMEMSIWTNVNYRRYEFSQKENEQDEYLDRYFGFVVEQVFYCGYLGKTESGKDRIRNKLRNFFDSEELAVRKYVASDLDINNKNLDKKQYEQALLSLRAPILTVLSLELVHAAKKYIYIADELDERKDRIKKLNILSNIWFDSTKDSTCLFYQILSNVWKDIDDLSSENVKEWFF